MKNLFSIFLLFAAVLAASSCGTVRQTCPFSQSDSTRVEVRTQTVTKTDTLVTGMTATETPESNGDDEADTGETVFVRPTQLMEIADKAAAEKAAAENAPAVDKTGQAARRGQDRDRL